MKKQKFDKQNLLIDEVFERSIKYQNSAEFIKFFNFIAGFDHYSKFNSLMVYLQDESVTFYGGSNFWLKKFDRTIKVDAKPYIILQPFGPIMLVYDIFETEGELEPKEFMEKGLGVNPYRIKGDLRPGVLERVISTIQSFKINVLFRPLSYFEGGHITTKISNKLEIVLSEGKDNNYNLGVLIHELAHLMLGHTGHTLIRQPLKDNKFKDINIPDRQLSLVQQELEAETVSFLICKKFGIELRSAEYLAGYITDESDLKKFSREMVVVTTDKIERFFLNNLLSFT